MPIRISDRPYQHRGKWRFYISAGPGSQSWAPAGSTELEARQLAEAYVEGLQERVDQTVGGLLELYLQHLRDNDRKASTVHSAEVKLGLLLGPLRDRPASSITPAAAQQRYRALTETYSAAYHRSCLKLARILWRWAIDGKLVSSNPWASVRPVGRVNKGKEQLRLDEARKLVDCCLEHVMRDDGALAVLLALVLGLRSSEITQRVVRDVDEGGRRLVVERAKTKAGDRAPEIPDFLQDAVRARTWNRGPAELLLPEVAHCSRSPHQWLARQVRRYCDLAGVPRVCPHALRGGWASAAYAAGLAPHVVAAAMGHASATVTEAHYATKASIEDGERARRLRLLKPV